MVRDTPSAMWHKLDVLRAVGWESSGDSPSGPTAVRSGFGIHQSSRHRAEEPGNRNSPAGARRSASRKTGKTGFPAYSTCRNFGTGSYGNDVWRAHTKSKRIILEKGSERKMRDPRNAHARPFESQSRPIRPVRLP